MHGFWFLPFATFAPGYLGFRFSPPVSLFLLLCPATAFTAKHTILPRPRRRRSRGDEGAGVPEGGGHRSHRRHRLSRRVELRRRKAVSAVKSRLLINNSSLTHPDPTLGVGRGSLHSSRLCNADSNTTYTTAGGNLRPYNRSPAAEGAACVHGSFAPLPVLPIERQGVHHGGLTDERRG